MNTMAWTLDEVAAITGGEVVGDTTAIVTSVGTDSRSVIDGSLFVAILGEHFDGHEFAAMAIKEGAVGALVSAATFFTREAGGEHVPAVVVENTLGALLALAEDHRDRFAGKVIAITGSTGKTSTKDLLAAVLPHAHASPRSFNNNIGVPITILGAPLDAPFMIVEVGSRSRGHIDHLMSAVRPDVAVITNLGVVHLETFGTLAALADAKWELAAAVGSAGHVVIPVDEPRLARDTDARVWTFGENGTVGFADLTVDACGLSTFTLVFEGDRYPVRLRMAGQHQVLNAAAAFAAAVAAGADPQEVAAGLELATGSPWRMEIHRGRFTVVNDAYNANPDSMRSAIETVTRMPGRRIAVVGYMAELGQVAAQEHSKIGQLLRERHYESVVIVGEEPGMAEAYGPSAVRVDTVADAVEATLGLVRTGDVVLVKASRSVGLEHVAARLVEEANA